MFHTNGGTNGVSLEDCHTNVFVLTELQGLKWVRLGPSGSNGICTDVADDPVLWAYGRCLTQGQLCVWRRSPLLTTAHSPAVDLKLSNEKELWIFWYGDEPDWKSHVQLTKLEESSWDGAGGISYEVRTLLFKALHNLIERCLLQRDFVRLGKWFVQPLDAEWASRREKTKYILAFSFTFFLHGENNVCVSVDVQPQPLVFKLNKIFFQVPKQHVVLVPWGLSAWLSDTECSDTDPTSSKLWREWSNFYPLPEVDSTENMGYVDPAEEQQSTVSKLPKMVEIVVGGVRMKYPSCYVVIVGDSWLENSPTSSPHKGGGSLSALSPPSSPDTASSLGKRQRSNSQENWLAATPCGSLDLGARVLCRTSQDSMICKRPSAEPVPPDEVAGVWDFRDVTHNQKISCGCPKKSVATKAQLKFGCPPASKHRFLYGGDRAAFRNGRSVPFHKRTSLKSSAEQCKQQQPFAPNSFASRLDDDRSSRLGFSLTPCDGGGEGTPAISTPTASGNPSSLSVSVQQQPPQLSTDGAAVASLALSGGMEPSVQMISPVNQSLPVTPQGTADMPTSSSCTTTSTGSSGFLHSSLQLGNNTNVYPPSSLYTSSSANYSFQNNNSNNVGSAAVECSGSPTFSTSVPESGPFISTLSMASNNNNAGDTKPVTSLDEFLSSNQQSGELSAVVNGNCSSWIPQPTDVKLVVQPRLTGGEATLADRNILSARPNLNEVSIDNSEDIDIVELFADAASDLLNLCWNKHTKKARLSCSVASLPARCGDFDRFSSNAAIQGVASSGKTESNATDNIAQLLGGSHGGYMHQNYVAMPTSLGSGIAEGQSALVAVLCGTAAGSSEFLTNVPEISEFSSSKTAAQAIAGLPGSLDTRNTSFALTSSKSGGGKFAGANAPTTLPDNFLDDNDSDEKEDADGMIITPPPSNETHDRRAFDSTTNKLATTRTVSNKLVSGICANGPGSAGAPTQADFNKIFPTPPSISDYMHNNVISPANDHPGQSFEDLNTVATCSTATIVNPSFTTDWSSVKCRGLVTTFSEDSKTADVFVKPVQASFMIARDFLSGGCDGEDLSTFCVGQKALPSTVLSSGVPQYKPSGARAYLGLWPASGGSTIPGGSGSTQLSSYLAQSLPPGTSSQNSWMASILDYPPSSVGERPVPSVGSSRGPEPSPANPSSVYSVHNHRTPKTPCMADLQSPGSNASSCLRNVSSIDNMPSAGLVPEAHSLVVTLLLCDSFVNIFRDCSFDSCALCACDMSVKGMDMGIYVVPPPTLLSDGPIHNSKCMCGYSAIRYRYLSHRSGVFYEDECEITGQWHSKRIPKDDCSLHMCPELVDLIRTQCLASHSFCSLYINNSECSNSSEYVLRDLEYKDFLEQCNAAIEQGCLVMDCTLPSTADLAKARGSVLNKWPFLSYTRTTEEFQVLSVLKNLLEPLQASLQKSRGLWQTKHGVEGPLSWRFFHRRCFHRHLSTGTEDQCEPEPIPTLMLSYDRDWITTSPYALQFWDKLMLEPYAQQRDVAYVVVAPDSSEVLNHVRSFFRELSKVYESTHLGRHCPITKVLKDGIMRVGKTRAKTLAQKEVDGWFSEVEKSSPIGPKLKLYAQVCRHQVGLALDQIDASIFRESRDCQTPAPVPTLGTMPPPAVPSDPNQFLAGGSDPGVDKSDCASENVPEDNALNPPVLVIYIVNPFTYGEGADSETARLASIGLLRCYLEMLKEVPENIKSNTQLQIVSLSTILDGVCDEQALAFRKELRVDANSGLVEPPHVNNWLANVGSKSLENQLNHMKSIALSVYAQSRSISLQSFLSMQAKTLTGFGPSAARAELIRRNQDHFNCYRVHCPPFILAPGANRSGNDNFLSDDLSLSLVGGGAACSTSGRETVPVLFVSYLLSKEQRWLFATCTDQSGELLENAVINLNVPERKCCQRGAVIKEAMKRLWEFILGTIATSTKPWRLVVGRVGRLGHGELRVWSHYLSKTSLKQASRMLKTMCSQCPLMPSFHDVPCILSACLVSMEPDMHLRIFAKSFSPVERFGQSVKQSPLSTPEDASCTHILVFPTSAATQISGGGVSGHEINTAMEDDYEIGIPDFLDLPDDDLFQNIGQDMSGLHGGRVEAMTETFVEESLQQQPLAIGYYISTAPAGCLPASFWSSCPTAQFRCPTHLKFALLIHTASAQQSEDQILHTQTNAHPLDSQLTSDVLRHVLETYNALSWLNIDMTTGDRRSCLPVHIQALLRLYDVTASLL